MSMSTTQSPTTGSPRRADAPDVPPTDTAETTWRPLYLLGGAAALLSIVFTVQAVYVFLLWPPPTTIEKWFALFQQNGFLGLLDLDLLMVVSYALLIPLYVALFGALRHASQSLMAIALAFNLVGAALILAANPGVAMLGLSGKYAAATTDAQRAAFLAAGQALMANWSGTGFVVGYLLGGIALLITAIVILRSKVFSKPTAYAGFAAGVLMLVPASAGTVGLIISLVSLAPTVVFLILVGLKLLRMSGLPIPGRPSKIMMVHPQ